MPLCRGALWRFLPGSASPGLARRKKEGRAETRPYKSLQFSVRAVFAFHGGIHTLPTGLPLGHSKVSDPENGYSAGFAANPLRTGFIQIYHATDSESSA